MSTDVPFTPPKKKPSIFWWLGGAFVVLVLIFLLQLFGPSPRIVVSPQTIHITDPLRPNGLPDYEAHTLAQMRDGVTPENNAAALIWAALWPGELDPPQYAAVAAELGLDAIPSTVDAVVPINKRIADWLKSQQPPAADSEEPAGETASTVDLENLIFQRVTSRPWSSSDFPWLAKWVSENQKPLDMMVAASHRPRCYFPSPNMLDQRNDMLLSMLLPGVQSARESGRSLVARAMWHVGEQRPAEAWRDLLAIHRNGRLVAQGPTLIDQLVGIAIAGMADRGTVTMLHEGRPSAELARQVMRELGTVESFSRMADSINKLERLSFLDAVTQLSRGTTDQQTLALDGVSDEMNFLSHLRIDWNIVLRKGNQWYDRYVAAAKLPTFTDRQQALAQIDRDIPQLTGGLRVNSVVASALNPAARSDAVASLLVTLFLPAIEAAVTAQDRANSSFELTRLAAALAVYRAENGSYPEKLDDLVPTVLEKLPVDRYQAKPYVYKRIDAGYLLYTTGPNGRDDGGSSEIGNILNGDSFDHLNESQAETQRAKIPSGADDMSIRVPPPQFNLPTLLPKAAEP